MGINTVYKPTNIDINKASSCLKRLAQGHCCTCHLSTQARLCLMHSNHEREFDFDFDLYMLNLFLAWNKISWRQKHKMALVFVQYQ